MDEKSLFAFSPITEKARCLDKESLLQFLDRRVTGLDAKELIGTTTGLEMLWDRSVAMFLRDEIGGTGQGLEEIVGGMDLLPTTLAGKLSQGCIRLNSEVLAIRSNGPKATLVLRADGKEPIEYACDHLVCTIPFGVLRRLDLQGFSAGKLEAIRNLSYASSTKVFNPLETKILGRREIWNLRWCVALRSNHPLGLLPVRQRSTCGSAYKFSTLQGRGQRLLVSGHGGRRRS